MSNIRKLFDLLNNINHTPSKTGGNAKIVHKESIVTIVTSQKSGKQVIEPKRSRPKKINYTRK